MRRFSIAVWRPHMKVGQDGDLHACMLDVPGLDCDGLLHHAQAGWFPPEPPEPKKQCHRDRKQGDSSENSGSENPKHRK